MNKFSIIILIFFLFFSCQEPGLDDETKKTGNPGQSVVSDSISLDSLRAIYGDSIEVVDLELTSVEYNEKPPPPPPPPVKPKPVIVTLSESKLSNFDAKDPTFLSIKIIGENYEISFLNKKLQVNTLVELDTFLNKNKNLINKNKVFATGFHRDKNKNFVKLLSKYGISKFRVNSE